MPNDDAPLAPHPDQGWFDTALRSLIRGWLSDPTCEPHTRDLDTLVALVEVAFEDVAS